MPTVTYDDITKHKPFPIKSLKVYETVTDIHIFQNLMAESSCNFEPVVRKDRQGADRTVAIKFTATIYINRPDIISLLEFLCSTKRDIAVQLGGYDNITGAGTGLISIAAANLSVSMESANKFLKTAVKIYAVIPDISYALSVT